MAITTWAKWVFELWQFLWFSKCYNLIMVELTFNFVCPLTLNINVNDGQNKFGVHISKNEAKIPDFRPKIGQDAPFAQTLNGHKSTIFYPVLTRSTPHQND